MPTAVATAPCLSLNAQDVAATVNALEACQALYSPLMARREQRSQLALYWRGLLSELPRKSIEPIVLRLHGTDLSAVRTLQTFVNQGAWEDALLLRRHWQEVELDLGCEQGVLMVDGSDFPKQGRHSAGVKRQYCGELGKRANCQAGVFVGYASGKGYTLLHRRLCLPQEWLADDAFQERRERCGIPAGTEFATKPELALEMLREVVEAGTLRCRWVAADEAFGRDTAFLDGVGELGLWYFVEVPHDTQVWLERPLRGVPEWSGRGRKPKRERILGGSVGVAGGGPGGAVGGVGVEAAADTGRKPRPAGSGVCEPPGGGRAGGFAWAGGVVGVASEPCERGVEDLSEQRASGDERVGVGALERNALAGGDVFCRRETTVGDGFI